MMHGAIDKPITVLKKAPPKEWKKPFTEIWDPKAKLEDWEAELDAKSEKASGICAYI